MAILSVTKQNLTYFTAEGIAVPHCFTTRLGGVSQGYLGSLNLGANRGDSMENVEKNYKILANALPFSPQNAVLTRQTHSDIVRVVGKQDHRGFAHMDYPECDGLVTNDPGTALVVFTADCTPILLYDPHTGAVGAVHAGWRGTASQIGAKAVKAMVEHFGSKPEHIRAAIGPNIGQCCFETDADVPKAMLDAYGIGAQAYISRQGGKYYVNLKALNALSLQRLGVRQVEISQECTACSGNLFWSHRVTGDRRGSQGAVIVCKEG